MYKLLEAARQVFRHFSRLSITYLSAINVNNRNEFSRRSSEEHFIGIVQVIAIHHALTHLVASLASKVHHDVPCDAFKNPGMHRRSYQRIALDEEDVVACGFRDKPLMIQHYCFH